MGETNQIVILDPSETIIFNGDVFRGKAMASLVISNPSGKPIFFKVKTTKPFRYCVSPALGLLDENTTIELILKIKEKGVESDEIRKDKFLIQTIYQENVPGAGEDAVTAFNMANKENIYQKRLFVTSQGKNLVAEDLKHADSASFRSASPSDTAGQEGIKHEPQEGGKYFKKLSQEKEESVTLKNGKKSSQENYSENRRKSYDKSSQASDEENNRKLPFGFHNKIKSQVSNAFTNVTHNVTHLSVGSFGTTFLLLSLLTTLVGLLLGYYYQDQIELWFNTLIGNYKHCGH